MQLTVFLMFKIAAFLSSFSHPIAYRILSVMTDVQPFAPPHTAALTAPQCVCPSTKTVLTRKCSTAYSIIQSSISSATLPATLITNSSPIPDIKISSGTTRESEHVITTAYGRYPFSAVSFRTFADISPSLYFAQIYFAFPSLSFLITDLLSIYIYTPR